MGVLFETFNPGACSLCGSVANLTGEHKFKASVLRKEFGDAGMVVGGNINTMKSAQSVKSKRLQFKSRLCARCNNFATQPADREFDHFHDFVRDKLESSHDPENIFTEARYQIGSDEYLNIFRYFAKILCCFVAEVGGPRPLHLSAFARGENTENCVWLRIDKDPTYQKSTAEFGSHSYAAHGGLIIYGDKKTGGANAFHSTLTFGSVRYVFWSRLNIFERLELRWLHNDFYEWCRAKVSHSMLNPLSDDTKNHLGI